MLRRRLEGPVREGPVQAQDAWVVTPGNLHSSKHDDFPLSSAPVSATEASHVPWSPLPSSAKRETLAAVDGCGPGSLPGVMLSEMSVCCGF